MAKVHLGEVEGQVGGRDHGVDGVEHGQRLRGRERGVGVSPEEIIQILNIQQRQPGLQCGAGDVFCTLEQSSIPSLKIFESCLL